MSSPPPEEVQKFLDDRDNTLLFYSLSDCDHCNHNDYIARSQLYMKRIEWLLDYPDFKQPSVNPNEIPHDGRHDSSLEEYAIKFQQEHGFPHFNELFKSQVFRNTYVKRKKRRERAVLLLTKRMERDLKLNQSSNNIADKS